MIKKRKKKKNQTQTKPLLLCTEVYDSYLLHALFNSPKVLGFFLASLCLPMVVL